MWGSNNYLKQLYASAEREAEGMRRQAWTERRADIRSRLVEALGAMPDVSSALEPVVLERTERPDYIRERVFYTTDSPLCMPAYVLIPKKREGRLPVVLAWHGHGYGSREIVGLRPDGTEDDGPAGIHRHFALELVRRGMMVIAPEIIGFGDRRLAGEITKDPRKSSSCSALASRLLLYGRTLAGLRVYEAMRTIDYALTRDDADPERIGCVGFSGGGLIAAFSAALDSRIGAAVLCGFTSTFRGSLLAMNHCIDNYLPALMPHADLPELIGLIAPRPLFVESGLDDSLFPAPSVRKAIECLENIYREEQAEERLAADLFPGGHEVSGRHSFDWLARELKAGFPYRVSNDHL